ncbi:hypothetical protein [Chitinophaga caseinilytica]|uniref:Uncharacterized protein n=1 Tax=Chitinophaga caseinilytica TaxID=2267521 RepID=A0ABZ2YXG3_9BACT
MMLIVGLVCSSAKYQSIEGINDTTAKSELQMSRQAVLTVNLKHFADMIWGTLNFDSSVMEKRIPGSNRNGFIQAGKQDYAFEVEPSTDRVFVTFTNEAHPLVILIFAATLLALLP